MKGLLQALPKDLLCAKLHQLPAASMAAPSASPCQQSPTTWQQDQRLSHTQRYGHALSDMQQADALSSRQQPQTLLDSSHAQQAGAVTEEQQNKESPGPQQDGATRRSSSRHGEGGVWLLLSDGALPACCAAVQQSTDAHHKFHAVSALAYCLDRIKQCLQVWPYNEQKLT